MNTVAGWLVMSLIFLIGIWLFGPFGDDGALYDDDEEEDNGQLL